MPKSYHETNEELKRRSLQLGHKRSSKPENKRNNEENKGLRERIQQIAPERRPIGLSQRLLQTLAVQSETVVLPRQRSDRADRPSGFAGKLSRFLVGFLVGLVLEHNNTL